jgi:peptidyl-prolyl cis-trans isomerase A (cyclophilin A)
MSEITKRQLLALAAALGASPAFAQTPAPAPTTPATPAAPPAAAVPAAPPPAAEPAAPDYGRTTRVRLATPLGPIVLDLFTEKAPVTSANFLKYVDRKLYDGATFYRASKPPGEAANDYGVVQGGLQNDPKKVLPPIAHESTVKTGLAHKDGTISMGRHAPGSAQADWFICVGDQSYLDADPKDPKKNPGFAAFGHVVEGMDVVQKILGRPVDANKGEGAMKGEMLKVPVPITSVRRA